MNGPQDANGAALAGGTWMADSMRMTLFMPTARDWKEALLEKLIGQSPDMEQTSKRPGLPNKLEAARAGNFQVNAVAQANRLDVHLSVSPTPEDADSIVRGAEEFRELLNTLAANANVFAPFARIGVGASLLRKCADKTEAYDKMRDRFPCLGIDSVKSDDFMFQLNRLEENAENGRMNHIERWSYGVFERIDIPTMSGPLEITIGTKKVEGVKLDLDFNTAVDNGKLIDVEAAKRVAGGLVESIYEKMKSE